VPIKPNQRVQADQTILKPAARASSWTILTKAARGNHGAEIGAVLIKLNAT
jgi:hypothetical protein